MRVGALEEEDDAVTFGCVEFKMLWRHPSRKGENTIGQMVPAVRRTFWLETMDCWVRPPRKQQGAKDRAVGCKEPEERA